MKHLLFITFFLTSLLSFPQDKIWTLDGCITYAIEHSRSAGKQAAQNSIYKIDKRETVAGFLPSVAAGTSVSSSFGRGVDPETNTYISTNTLSNSYEISASMTLFDGFSQIYRAKLAKINRLMGNDQLQDTKDRIALDVMETYFNALYYRGTVELAGQQVQESTDYLKQMERMEELGMKAAPDVAEIRAKAAEDQFRLTQQKNILNLEIIKLKEKMNLPVDEELEIAEVDGYDLLSTLSGENPVEIFEQASQTLPRLLSSEKALKAREAEYKAIRGRLLPTISAGAGFSTGFSRLMDGSPYTSFREQLKNRQGSYVGVSLSIPLFDRFSRISETQRARQRLIIARNENEELERQVYSEIEQAIADVKGLNDQSIAAGKKTEAMEAAHKINIRKYAEGLINGIELTTSANRLLNSRVEELHTNLQLQLKSKLLNYYKGKTLWIQ
jgi:outer membrane protein TolC